MTLLEKYEDTVSYAFHMQPAYHMMTLSLFNTVVSTEDLE